MHSPKEENKIAVRAPEPLGKIHFLLSLFRGLVALSMKNEKKEWEIATSIRTTCVAISLCLILCGAWYER